MQALDGIVEHVKLLLIDSSVFAEEVEPTGVVSMETSLEKWGFYAFLIVDDASGYCIESKHTVLLHGEKTAVQF